MRRNQRGSSHIVLLLGVVVIAVVAFAGYRVINADQPAASSSPLSSSSSSAPKSIKSSADVKKADKSLDKTAIDGQVNPNQLDNDLDSLL